MSNALFHQIKTVADKSSLTLKRSGRCMHLTHRRDYSHFSQSSRTIQTTTDIKIQGVKHSPSSFNPLLHFLYHPFFLSYRYQEKSLLFSESYNLNFNNPQKYYNRGLRLVDAQNLGGLGLNPVISGCLPVQPQTPDKCYYAFLAITMEGTLLCHTTYCLSPGIPPQQ